MYTIKPWRELTIRDNYLFQKLMQNNVLCKAFIEKLLHIKITKLTYSDIEKSLTVKYYSKSIRLDVYVETDTGEMINIEMQSYDTTEDELARRTRYYQSIMDINDLEKGKAYEELSNSYIIFICSFDPFGADLRQYTFHNRCEERPDLTLKDGATRIFLNAKGTTGEIDPEIADFLAYVNGAPAKGQLTTAFADELYWIKERTDLEVEYMTFTAEMMRWRSFGRAEGKAEGRAEGKAEGLAEGKAEGLAEGMAARIWSIRPA